MAVRSLLYTKGRSILLICGIAVSVIIPAITELSIQSFESQLYDRNKQSEIIIGPKHSHYNLVFHNLQFSQKNIRTIPFASLNKLEPHIANKSVPVYSTHKYRNFPIVGVSKNYYTFYKLELNEGELPLKLGTCIIGSDIADEQNLKLNDYIQAQVKDPFDINAAKSLKLKITGILKPAYPAENRAVFTSLETSWLIAGYGHGHNDKEKRHDNENLIDQAELDTHQEVKDSTAEDFHFHSDYNEMPLTAILIAPESSKEKALILASFEGDNTVEAVDSIALSDEIMTQVFRFKSFLNLSTALIISTLCLSLFFIIYLSLKEKKSERALLNELGINRSYQNLISGGEYMIIISLALVLSTILIALFFYLSNGDIGSYILQFIT